MNHAIVESHVGKEEQGEEGKGRKRQEIRGKMFTPRDKAQVTTTCS